VNLIQWEELSRVVLCGHSYGGCVVTGVADRIPDRIEALVYLDAFVPQNGQSLHDLLPAEQREAQVQGAKQIGDGWKVPPISAEVFHVNAGDRDRVNRQCTMHPLAAMQQPLRLTGGIDEVKNITYILAGEWLHPVFASSYERAKAKGWKTLAVQCGHDVMLDMPEELTQALLAASPRGV
jgi:pimeloyl-ACP methyl ester carboxylesterase